MLQRPDLNFRKKLIIYLDQNFISGIVKSKTTEGKKNASLDKLDVLLSSLVEKEKIICPLSCFYEYETPPKYHEVLQKFSVKYSWGFKFMPELKIRHNQILDAAIDFLECPKFHPLTTWWEIAYNRNPDMDTRDELMDGIHISVIGGNNSFYEFKENTKSNYLDWFSKLQEDIRKRGVKFDVYKEEEINGCIRGLFLTPIQTLIDKRKKGEIITQNDMDAFLNSRDAIMIFDYYKNESQSTWTIEDFIKSERLRITPFIKIYSHLFAAVLTEEVSHKNRESDPMDFSIIANIFPYIDIFCTDSANKELINRLGFDKEYNVNTFKFSELESLIEKLKQHAI